VEPKDKVVYPELTVLPDLFVANSFEAEFQTIYSEAFSLLVAKQRRYGNSNVEQLGLHGVISRIAFDKVSRALKFMNGRVVNGKVELDEMDESTEESLEDTLLDIANYALIAVALRRGLWGKPLESDIVLAGIDAD
jgi:hypothetical protein